MDIKKETRKERAVYMCIYVYMCVYVYDPGDPAASQEAPGKPLGKNGSAIPSQEAPGGFPGASCACCCSPGTWKSVCGSSPRHIFQVPVFMHPSNVAPTAVPVHTSLNYSGFKCIFTAFFNN